MKNFVIISVSVVMFLGVSILLYLHRTPPTVEKIDQKIAGIGTSGTIIHNSTIVLYTSQEEDKINIFQIQYVRAFGAYRVPSHFTTPTHR